MPKLILFAREVVVTRQTINPQTGKVETTKINSLDPLREAGIEFVPMPEDYVLGQKKNKEALRISELGLYVLCKVNDQGQVENDWKAGNLRRPLVVDLPTLMAIFNLKKERPQKVQDVSKK